MAAEHNWSRCVLPYLPTGAPALPTDTGFDSTSLLFAGSQGSKRRMFVDTTPGSTVPGSPG